MMDLSLIIAYSPKKKKNSNKKNQGNARAYVNVSKIEIIHQKFLQFISQNIEI